MAAYDHDRYVEPLGYQPVEFLDLPSLSDRAEMGVAPAPAAAEPGAHDENPDREADPHPDASMFLPELTEPLAPALR